MSTFCSRILIASLALAAVLAVSGSAMGAEPESVQGAANLGQERRDLAEKPDLVGKLYEDFRNSTLAAREELLAKRRELDAQMNSAHYDEQKVQSLAKDIADLRARLHSARVALKDALIKEGIAFGHHEYGPGMGRGSDCCGPVGGYGPGMRRGFGGGDACGRCGGDGPGMGRGYGRRFGGGW